MTSLAVRLSRLLGQSRITLPRWPPERLHRGDRLQIGAACWRVRGELYLWSGAWAYFLEDVDDLSGPRTARLLLPADAPKKAAGLWTFILEGRRTAVPAEGVVVFASPTSSAGSPPASRLPRRSRLPSMRRGRLGGGGLG